MKATIFLTIVAIVATVGAAPPGYKYTGPAQHQQQSQQAIKSQPINNFRPSPQISAPSGIYSAVQSLPLAQFNVQGERQQSFVAPQPQPLPQSRPVALQAPPPPPPPPPPPQPQQIYLPPQQLPPQQLPPQPQAQPQPQQPLSQPLPQSEAIYLAPQESIAAVPSIPQGHQQQIVQQQLGGGFQQQQQLGGGFQQQQLGGGGFQQQQLGGGGFQQPLQQNYQPVQRPQTAIITKDIYIHSAPEDLDDGNSGPQGLDGPLRKNYRIVFIKAPSQNLRAAAAALKRAQAANEEKTVIYVLSKKPDLSEVQQQLQLAQSDQKPNKPEVYFIKYKTQEEALRAQQQIQAQYDALGGSTHISDEGVAPLTTVSGSANLSGPINPGVGGAGGQQHHVPAPTYGLKK